MAFRRLTSVLPQQPMVVAAVNVNTTLANFAANNTPRTFVDVRFSHVSYQPVCHKYIQRLNTSPMKTLKFVYAQAICRNTIHLIPRVNAEEDKFLVLPSRTVRTIKTLTRTLVCPLFVGVVAPSEKQPNKNKTIPSWPHVFTLRWNKYVIYTVIVFFM